MNFSIKSAKCPLVNVSLERKNLFGNSQKCITLTPVKGSPNISEAGSEMIPNSPEMGTRLEESLRLDTVNSLSKFTHSTELRKDAFTSVQRVHIAARVRA